jgi:hypothetical protein
VVTLRRNLNFPVCSLPPAISLAILHPVYLGLSSYRWITKYPTVKPNAQGIWYNTWSPRLRLSDPVCLSPGEWESRTRTWVQASVTYMPLVCTGVAGQGGCCYLEQSLNHCHTQPVRDGKVSEFCVEIQREQQCVSYSFTSFIKSESRVILSM